MATNAGAATGRCPRVVALGSRSQLRSSELLPFERTTLEWLTVAAANVEAGQTHEGQPSQTRDQLVE